MHKEETYVGQFPQTKIHREVMQNFGFTPLNQEGPSLGTDSEDENPTRPFI